MEIVDSLCEHSSNRMISREHIVFVKRDLHVVTSVTWLQTSATNGDPDPWDDGLEIEWVEVKPIYI